MKLFKIEVRFKRPRRGRTGVDLVVHAKTRAAAEKHAASKYPGCTVEPSLELPSVTKHFVVADLVDE